MTNDLINRINNIIVENENISNNFLPLQEILNPIKNDINETLKELKNKADESPNISDKIFYINRYMDLIKKVDSIFEAKNKRLLQTLQVVAKNSIENNSISSEETEDNLSALTPEQCNEIFKIIKNTTKEGK